VAALDVQHSHRRSAVVLGPVEVPPLDTLRARFAAMSAVGPETRIGLRPATTSTCWHYAPDGPGQAVTASTMLVPGANPVALLAELRQLPDGGIRVLASDHYLAIDFSHGLGEIPLLDMLVAVLFGCADAADTGLWAPYRHSVSPLLAAAVRTVALGPQRLLPLWRQHRRNNTGPVEPTAVRGADIHPSPATRVARIPTHTVTELRRQRDSALPGVSMFALFTCALHEAFSGVGFDVDPTVTLPFDVRRYLPDGWDTLASFSAGLDFTVDRHAGPRGLHDAMTAAVGMGRPVANLAVSSVKARAAMRKDRRTEWTVSTQPQLRLLHSSIGTVPRAGWSFSDPEEARILVASDPVGPCGVTVTTATVTGALWMTAEFHDSVFDAERVAAALNSVPTRAQSFLRSTSPT
jgi:hypothetical protein